MPNTVVSNSGTAIIVTSCDRSLSSCCRLSHASVITARTAASLPPQSPHADAEEHGAESHERAYVREDGQDARPSHGGEEPVDGPAVDGQIVDRLQPRREYRHREEAAAERRHGLYEQLRNTADRADGATHRRDEDRHSRGGPPV